ncbi:MAG: hypothetical protein R3Y09_10940 [Clostridia bacterium]
MEYVKNALEQVFNGKMSVFTYEKVKQNSKTTLQKTLVFDNIPCLLTSMVLNRSIPRDIGFSKNFVKTNKVKKVFLANNFDVKLGSYVEILQDGKLYSFDYSGEVFYYKTHQEIILETQDVV